MKSEKICENIETNGKDLVYINIVYPQTDGLTTAKKKINVFYSSVSKEFRDYAAIKLKKSAENEQSKNKNFIKYGAAMKYTVSFENETYLSILMDISVYNGKNIEKTRFSTVWDLRNASILSIFDFIKKSKQSKAIIIEKINEIFENNFRNNNFINYYVDSSKILNKLIELNNFYLTPNGYAFYVKCEKLSFGNNCLPVFVIPYKTLLKFNLLDINSNMRTTM